MAAYVIADTEVHDPQAILEYQRQVPATLAPYGGRFLVRGGAVAPAEGDYRPQRMVVLEFPDMAAAKAWYASPAYQAILPLRQRHSRAHFLVFVEGA